ncbi:hypothetical protein ACFYTQ_35085 [Nocardia sp. NPDC004068]|uniref:hypothetical protein n=1 Tax=Nocardia sp. NPDC004068 TaxID=3364303 RepID=UPI00367A41A7
MSTTLRDVTEDDGVSRDGAQIHLADFFGYARGWNAHMDWTRTPEAFEALAARTVRGKAVLTI